jgi:hypothetical protein
VWWASNRNRIPMTRIHRTRSGGIHVLFKHHVYLRCSTRKLALGVDTRGEGGYIIWWPAHGYQVFRDVPICDPPRWLIEALRPPPPPLPRPIPRAIPNDRALFGVIRRVVEASEGERNAVTFWAACRVGEMVIAGVLSEAAALSVIVEAATRAGLPQRKASRTARSGIRAARG